MINGWAYNAIYRSSSERTAALDGWMHYYNHERRHSARGHQPPIARLNERTNLTGSYSSPPPGARSARSHAAVSLSKTRAYRLRERGRAPAFAAPIHAGRNGPLSAGTPAGFVPAGLRLLTRDTAPSCLFQRSTLLEAWPGVGGWCSTRAHRSCLSRLPPGLQRARAGG
jgi:hypothetical protein